MYNDSLYLQALHGEREEQVARHRREYAGLRAASNSHHPLDVGAAFTRLVRAVRPSHRPASAGARSGVEPGPSNTTAT